MGKYIVFGGTGGLGRRIMSDLVGYGNTAISVSRAREIEYQGPLHSHFTLDLSDFKDSELSVLFSWVGPLDGLCFAHRYRPTSETCPLSEYKTMVHSVSRIVNYIQRRRDITNEHRYCRILLIGSSYTYSAGRDQGWSYHACKHALHGLVRYFSANTGSGLLFFMVSPPTFMKQGSEAYWASSGKSSLWKNFPSKGLIDVATLSELCCEILIQGSPLLNGCNLPADSGLSNIYQDQVTE